MEFKLVRQIVDNIQQTIGNTAIASVNALKAHTYGVKVKNFPKNQRVSGVISVSNQKRVESELKKANTLQKTILNWLKDFKLPSEIKISNFPDPTKFPDFPSEIKVSNFPKQKDFPKNIRITNQPTTEIKRLEISSRAIERAIKNLKLNPEINVQAPPSEKIIVPAPSVKVTQKDIDYKKLASSIPKPKEIDYKKMSEAIAKEIAESIVTVGGGSRSSSSSGGSIAKDALPIAGVTEAIGAAIVDGSGNQITTFPTTAGLSVPAHDYIALTYVAAGNGAGEIETAVFKTGGSGGTTVATLTLAYNASNEISSVTKT